MAIQVCFKDPIRRACLRMRCFLLFIDVFIEEKSLIGHWCVTGPPGKPKGPVEVLDVQKDSVLISWKPPEDDGGKPLT